MAQLAVPDVADWCAVDIADDDGRLKRLGTAHIDPAKVEFARTLRERFPEDPDSPGTPSHVFRTRQPAVISGITDEMLQHGARSPAHLRGAAHAAAALVHRPCRSSPTAAPSA